MKSGAQLGGGQGGQGPPLAWLRGGHAPPLRSLAPPCRGQEVHPVLQFSDSWILTLSKFKSSYRKIKKNNWTLVYWAYSSIDIALNTPYTHTHRPSFSFFISYQMCWLTEYPVGKVSFLLFEYNTHFSCPPLKMFRGGQKKFWRFARNISHLPPHNKMSSCAPVRAMIFLHVGSLEITFIVQLRSSQYI